MWTAKNRGRYDRSKLRYPSDLTDFEWSHVAALIRPATRRQQALRQRARSDERDHVHPEHRMSVAGDPQRPAAAQHAVRLPRFVELRRHTRSHESVCAMLAMRLYLRIGRECQCEHQPAKNVKEFHVALDLHDFP